MTVEETRTAPTRGRVGPGSEEAAFEALFRAESVRVLAYARTRVGADTAEDVVADTFAVVWRRWDRVPVENPRAWLLAVARRVIANHHRTGRRHPGVSLDGFTPAGADTLLTTSPATDHGEMAETVTRRLDLFRAMTRLRPGDREVLLLATWFDLDPAGIGAVLGCTRPAAAVRLHRARRRLRAHLDPEDPR